MDKLKLETVFSTENPVFSGGFGLAVIAAGMQIARAGVSLGLKALRRNFLVTLEVTSKDRSYPWVLQWVTRQGTRTQHLSVETTFKPTTGNMGNMKFDLVPGPGQHVIYYGGKFVLIQRVREQTMMDLNSGKPWEKVVFTSYGRSTNLFNSLLNEAYEQSVKTEEGKTIIFTNWGAEWRQFGQPRVKRSVDSVILDQGVSENLLKDVQEWMASSQWYSDRGIPYRRGYLLYGPPGSGKSSFIMALAGKMGYNICILNLSERGLTDERLALALSAVPPQSIVLLEDIDAAFPSRVGDTDAAAAVASVNRPSDVTFSGLLNVLDGVASSEERLVFMTTNHIDKLDPALIRPGRVDYVQLVDNASDYQIKRIFQRFYMEATDDMAEQFTRDLRSALPSVSMALLQGYLLRHKGDIQGALNNVNRLNSGEYAYMPPSVAAATRRCASGSSSGKAISSSSGSNESETTTAEYNDSSKSDGSKLDNVAAAVLKAASAVKTRPFRKLTAEEVDKMYFNPQQGWDKDLSEGTKKW